MAGKETPDPALQSQQSLESQHTLLGGSLRLEGPVRGEETLDDDSLSVQTLRLQSILGTSEQPFSGDARQSVWGRQAGHGKLNDLGTRQVAAFERQELGREGRMLGWEERKWRERGLERQELMQEKQEGGEGREHLEELESQRTGLEGRKGHDLGRIGQQTGREASEGRELRREEWEKLEEEEREGLDEREGTRGQRERVRREAGQEDRKEQEESERRKVGQGNRKEQMEREGRKLGQKLQQDGRGTQREREGRGRGEIITLPTLDPNKNLTVSLGPSSLFNAGNFLLSSLLAVAGVLGVVGLGAGVISAIAAGW